MPSRRDLLTIAAMIIADAAWLFPISGLLGHALGLHQPLLPLAIIPLLIAVAIAVVWTIAGTVEEPTHQGPYQAIVGLVTIYLVMAITIKGYNNGGGDLLWALHMFAGKFSSHVTGGLIIGCAAAAFLWFRGVGIAVETHPRPRLMATFRTGIVALAVAIVTEQAFGIDGTAAQMLIPFFVVCLAGLAFARLPPGGAWTTVVGAAIAVVLGGGFIIGLIAAALGGHGLDLIVSGWVHLTEALIWLVTLVLVPLLRLIAYLLPEFERGPGLEQAFQMPNLDFLRNLDSRNLPPEVENLNRLIMYVVIVLAVYLAYRLLLAGYRSHARRLRDRAMIERETIQGANDAGADLLKLALGLLPNWLLPATATPGPRIPQDMPGITEVFALYFDMLSAARDRGHDFVSSATPRERRAALEQALPGAPVAGITTCFNAACYGNIAADLADIARLRGAFEDAAKRQEIS
ncbi:MAG: DUF4129 domain-containing protein [Rhodospirillaceae bacterium]|jgi:hypothetical protein|nr:DUF4129 domain-containing protein [Rhodospirillaceae bacterium]MBT7760562.1 DUF4129 domain-containing protein [Rhodospirillaceae bacterium]